MNKTKSYKVVLINNETDERRLIPTRFTSRKKACEWADAFCRSIKTAGYEIKEM